MTGRPATMQCLLPDVTFEINGHEYTHEHAYFASVDEFTKAWPHHKRAKREGIDIKPRRQDPSRDFVNVWQDIGQQRIYVPSKLDVGRILKLECTPVSQNGLYTGKAVSVESAEVMQAPPQAPVRNLIEVPQPPNAFDPRAPKATFKVMTYNCLADIYATPQVCANSFYVCIMGVCVGVHTSFQGCSSLLICTHVYIYVYTHTYMNTYLYIIIRGCVS